MAPTAILIGPDGNPWDDGSGHTGVRRINLTHKEAIGSFNIVYDVNGEEQENTHLSGDNSYATAYVRFSFPDEKITRVSGYIGTVPNATTKTLVVRSITFTTNRRSYGPFGKEAGDPFSHAVPGGAFISGFFGRTSGANFLNAIRFYQAGP